MRSEFLGVDVNCFGIQHNSGKEGQTVIALDPDSRVSPLHGQKSPANAVHDTELDYRAAKYGVVV
jgi:hypothetical protein